MKKVAIVQSNYIPWKGYFDMIRSVDEFILFDDVQYTKRDWRNRNQIKTASGPAWLSISVSVKGKFHQLIRETLVVDSTWRRSHLSAIRQAYASAPCFAEVSPMLDALYAKADFDHLSDINRHFISGICDYLGITTRITSSMDYQVVDGKNERLIDLCMQAGAERYLAGPASRNYLDEAAFRAAGIEVVYMDYSNYPEYRQPHPPFCHQVSIIDLLASEGRDSLSFMKSIRG